jgi:hypothetical protein
MAIDDDPFSTLGVEHSASPDEIRSAYLRLLREHSERGGRQRIPALLRAYEIAIAVAQMRDEAGAPDAAERPGRSVRSGSATGSGWQHTVADPFRRPAGGWSRDPLVARVRRHIEDAQFEEAVEVATSPDWQQRLAAEEPAFAHATVRVACATVWTAPEIYERLVHAYVDRLEEMAGEHCASALPLMLALDSDWVGWRTFREPQPWLVDFLQLGMAGDRRLLRRIAREIQEQLAQQPRWLLDQLEAMASLSPALVAFVAHVARNVPDELVLPTTPEQGIEEIDASDLEAAFPRVRGLFLLPLLVAAIALVPGEALPLLVTAAAVMLYREAYYGGWYRRRLRARLLAFCLDHHLPPRAVATWAAQQPLWSRARPYAEHVDDVVIDAAYALGRFAHLLGR